MPENIQQIVLRNIFAFEKVPAFEELLSLLCRERQIKVLISYRIFFSSTERQLHLNMKFGLQKLLCQSLASMDCEGLDKILNSLEISFPPRAIPTACTETLYSKLHTCIHFLYDLVWQRPLGLFPYNRMSFGGDTT